MKTLVGTGRLVRLALRRDRILLPVWIAVLAGVTIGTASAFTRLYPTAASRQRLAATVAHIPALTALYGPAFDPVSVGGLTAWRMGCIGAVLTALMSLFIVIRHTRAEEEAGRLELVGSGAVGRHAALTAGLLVAFGAGLVLALLVAAGLVGAGLPAAGALALGLSFATAGWLFAAVAAVAAQLTGSARSANALAGTVLGLSYLLRATGDSAGEHGLSWLSWLSPIGWMQRTRPFAHERWWVFGMALAVVLVLAVAAYALAAHRDVGAGLLPPRSGPATAPARLRGPLALAWRLHRGTLLGWTAGFAVAGAALGSVADGIGDLAHSSGQLEALITRMGGRSGIVDAYLATSMGLLGLIASVYAVQATLRLRAEETGLRAEPVLASPVGRLRWAAGHLVFPAGGTVVLLTAAGLSAGLSSGLRTHDVAAQVPRVLGGALVQAPAVWVTAGLATALFGLLPRLTGASWAAPVAFLLLGQLGPVLRLDRWVMDVSPFTHVPKLPGAHLTLTPIGWLIAVAAGLTAAGLVGLRRRDIG